MIPREDPGGAIYCILLGSGLPVPRENGRSPTLNRCFRTSWSSWEKAHSVSDIKSLDDVSVFVAVAVGGGGVGIDCRVFGGGGVAGLTLD